MKRPISHWRRVRDRLVDELGISIVITGSNLVAEYIPVADTVLQVSQSLVSDITASAKELDIIPASAAPSMPLSLVESVALDYAEFD